jgi:hypothetical protein
LKEISKAVECTAVEGVVIDDHELETLVEMIKEA